MVTAWYFAYGSNMQTATLCGRRGIEFVRALPARVSGWRVVFDKPALLPVGESYANLVPEVGGEAFGVAYEIAPADLERIDFSEAVPLGNYQRIEIAAEPLAPGVVASPLPAHTLISDRRDPALCPSQRYMALVIAGAREHGLPAAYVAMLERVPARPESAAAAELRPLLDRIMKTGRL